MHRVTGNDLDILGEVFLERRHLWCFAGSLSTDNGSYLGSCLTMLNMRFLCRDGFGHTFTIFSNNLVNRLGFHTIDYEVACSRDQMTVAFDRDVGLFNTECDDPTLPMCGWSYATGEVILQLLIILRFIACIDPIRDTVELVGRTGVYFDRTISMQGDMVERLEERVERITSDNVSNKIRQVNRR